MREIVGDYWEHAENYQALVVTTNTTLDKNGHLVMGAGIAKSFKGRYPWLPKAFGDRLKSRRENGDELEDVMCVFDERELIQNEKWKFIIALPTKTDWRQPSPLSLIYKSIRQLARLSDLMGFKSVLMTRPGCGNGGRDWEKEIRETCEAVLDDRFTIISKEGEQ